MLSSCTKAATILMALCAVPAVQAVVIDDDSFFNSLDHTFIDFEIDGDGNDVVVANGTATAMPANEYIGQGFTFSPAIEWANDGGANFDAAQAIGGSLDNAIPAPASDDFLIEFTKPVSAFGFWVVSNTSAFTDPVFTAFDVGNQVIEQVTFAGPLIDGAVNTAQYGFMGIASDTPIASVRIEKDAALFDDFRFAPVPEPASAVIVTIGLLGWGVFRRSGSA